MGKNMPSWVTKANSYVHLDTHGIATIDPNINHNLTDQELDLVKKAVDNHNVYVRQHPVNGQMVSQTLPMGTRCQPVVNNTYPWWGISTYLNQCAVNDVLLGGGALSIIVGLCAPPVGAILGLITGEIAWASSQCSDGAVWINFIFGSPPPYATPAC